MTRSSEKKKSSGKALQRKRCYHINFVAEAGWYIIRTLNSGSGSLRTYLDGTIFFSHHYLFSVGSYDGLLRSLRYRSSLLNNYQVFFVGAYQLIKVRNFLV